MTKILKTPLSIGEIAIIKRDFDLLRKLLPSLTSDVKRKWFHIPLCFVTKQWYTSKKYNPSICVEQTSKYSINNIRQKAKFFDLSINKLIQSVDNVDAMQNEYFINLMKYPQLGYWNLHTNLGIYYDSDKHIVGNTHYAYYIFQDKKQSASLKLNCTI